MSSNHNFKWKNYILRQFWHCKAVHQINSLKLEYPSVLDIEKSNKSNGYTI